MSRATSRARAAAGACLVAAAVGGCLGPGNAAPRSAVQLAQSRHEYPAPVPAAETAPGTQSALDAVRRFAIAYINWTADSVVGDMIWLARRSVGQARSAMQLAAVQSAGDYELQRGGVANSGQVEAIAPRDRHTGEYVVVTRELTTATATTAYEGLAPAWHVILATVREEATGRWVVSQWQPEN